MRRVIHREVGEISPGIGLGPETDLAVVKRRVIERGHDGVVIKENIDPVAIALYAQSMPRAGGNVQRGTNRIGSHAVHNLVKTEILTERADAGDVKIGGI